MSCVDRMVMSCFCSKVYEEPRRKHLKFTCAGTCHRHTCDMSESCTCVFVKKGDVFDEFIGKSEIEGRSAFYSGGKAISNMSKKKACLATCLGVIASPGEPDYNQCHHVFSEGCPVHDSWSWKCAQHLKNCTDPDHRYHCILNTKRQVSHVCAPVTKCLKGTEPIYDEQKLAISCEPCLVGYFQKSNVWSDEGLKCEERHNCDIQSHKIECPVGLEMEKTQDTLCRCDARNNFVPLNFENADVCFPWTFTCWEAPCPGNETERLMNYTCWPKCQERRERNDQDICVPIGEKDTTTKGSPPPNTTVTATSTSYKPPEEYVSVTDYTIVFIILGVLAAVVLIALIVAIAVCIRARKKDLSNNSSLQDTEQRTPLQPHSSSNERDDAGLSPVPPSSQKGNTVINIENLNIKSNNLQLGLRNNMTIRQANNDDDSDDDIPENANNSHPTNSNSSSSENEGNITTHMDTSLDMPPSGDPDLNNVAHDTEENESPQDNEETFRKIP